MLAVMSTKTSADYQREYRQRMREAGLVKKEVWIAPDNAAALSQLEMQLRQSSEVVDLSNDRPLYDTVRLARDLQDHPLLAQGGVDLTLLEGVEPTIQLQWAAAGGLTTFVCAAGEQILVEAVLWPAAQVADPAGLNDAVLRTHKYFPLSTVSLDTLADGNDYYHIFGALSAASSLSEVVFELEMLVGNALQVTDAYADFLVAADGH